MRLLLPFTAVVVALAGLSGCGKAPESKPADPKAAGTTSPDADKGSASKSKDPMAPVQDIIAKLKVYWNPPGMPHIADKWEPPSAVKSVDTLFAENCQGCHGRGEKVAGSIAMDNPMYLALVSEAQLLDIINNGHPHNGMPAFAEAKGGLITDTQISILAAGIKAWAKNPPPAGPLPPYSAPLGNAQAGLTAFGVSCASCHGVDGTGVTGKAGSVVDPAYLGMASDQYLRSITIAGRNDLGCPDFQHRIPGRAMTNAEISDVVAWLASQRKNEFGTPLVPSQP